jgi:hypothetical protein
MPSPFPGMDPYVEEPALWPEVHGALLYRIAPALYRVLPRRYRVTVDRYVWLYDPEADTRKRLGKPDDFISDESGPANGAAGSVATLAAPVVATFPVARREGNRYLRIIDQEDRRVVTVIELLSPSNKNTNQEREEYLNKRNEYLATGTNLVEIDLLRAGERLPLGEPSPTPADYYILVSRAPDFPQVGVWPFSVRDEIPEVRVPLAPEEEPVTFSLRACLDQWYDEMHYGDKLDYTRPPVPPLRGPDADWARQLLASRPRPE